MAIKKEFYKTRADGVNLHRTFSDEGLKIQKVGTEASMRNEQKVKKNADINRD